MYSVARFAAGMRSAGERGDYAAAGRLSRTSTITEVVMG